MKRTPLRRRAKTPKTWRGALAPDEYTKLRAAVLARAGYRCEVPWCRRATTLDVHHVVKRSQGGADEAANLVALCRDHHDQTDRPGVYRLRITALAGGGFDFGHAHDDRV